MCANFPLLMTTQKAVKDRIPETKESLRIQLITIIIKGMVSFQKLLYFLSTFFSSYTHVWVLNNVLVGPKSPQPKALGRKPVAPKQLVDPLALPDGTEHVDDNGQNADIQDGDVGPHPSSPQNHHKCPHCLKVFQNFAVSLSTSLLCSLCVKILS